ncbi:MAG: SDR family NAD(P)-dependent oxidoreductase [Pseudomonadales bacterium]|nr:SDR family NAD(P)-dependent oxidoreductase [Pseudomonadales bacterium]
MNLTEVFQPGSNAVITGGANGIGLAAAKEYARRGMRVCIADRDETQLGVALEEINSIQDDLPHLGIVVDVSNFDQVASFRDQIVSRTDHIAVVMNNAGMSIRTNAFTDIDAWQKLLATNLWGVINGVQAFTSTLIDQGQPAMIINTGSKQGITNPPGNPAYNVTKAGIRSLTESLAHELRNIENCAVTAHLLVPGFTYTGLIRRFIPEQPSAAWSPEQVVEFMVEKLSQDAFYILCPDNDVSAAMDQKRIEWHTDDLIEGRSALSRWDPAYSAQFDTFMKD